MGEQTNPTIKIKAGAGYKGLGVFKTKDDKKPTAKILKTERYYSSPISLTSQFYFCPVPLRLDTYSGCSHNCLYCFANNSNMKFIIDADYQEQQQNVSVIPTKIEYIKKYFDIAFNGLKNTFSNQEAIAIECIKHKVPLHFGGMSDPLQPCEEKYKLTYKTLELLKSYEYPIIFSTKGRLLLKKEYFDLINDYENFALQISLIDDRQEVISLLEPNATSVEERFEMFKMYQHKWTACRIQPFIVGLSEPRIIPMLDKLKSLNVNHVMVEGLKFFSGNKRANKRIGEAFKKITGKTFDLLAYYKAIGAKHSGNDVELPSWRKYRYDKIFADECKKRGMTFGCADNDLRFLGNSPCCCGVEGLKGFDGMLRHNTGFAIFRAQKGCKKEFGLSEIQDEYFPDGKFRMVMSNLKAFKRYGNDENNKTSNRPIKELFLNAWNKGGKNSPCDVCIVKHLGCGKYRFLTPTEQEKLLKDEGEQKTLI